MSNVDSKIMSHVHRERDISALPLRTIIPKSQQAVFERVASSKEFNLNVRVRATEKNRCESRYGYTSKVPVGRVFVEITRPKSGELVSFFAAIRATERRQVANSESSLIDKASKLSGLTTQEIEDSLQDGTIVNILPGGPIRFAPAVYDGILSVKPRKDS